MYTAEFTKVPNNVTFYNLGPASIKVRALALKDAKDNGSSPLFFWMRLDKQEKINQFLF